MEKYKVDLISLKVCRERSSEFSGYQLSNPDNAYKVIREIIGDTDREYFGVCLLNAVNKINSIQICSIGTLSECVVHPREVFKSAIMMNSSKIILFHTHPSNASHPSKDDISITKKLIECSKLLDIPILDHIIICDDNYYSFAQYDILTF